ncbi:hypothetical protein MBLNU459_g1156t1 [Dothideomycetes sp. NU459]
MRCSRVSLCFALVHGALAAQPSAPSPIAAPLRELPWGQLNFLQTTDTHGWHGGHLQEPQYSADWGDYISFAQHLRDRADADGSDLLVVDTGDRVEGNGLYDASNPKGAYTFDIIKHQKIDIITSGNHELYKKNSSDNELYKTVPAFKDGYIASNLDIYDPETGKLQPLAPRYRKFTTKNQGIRIVAFGFLFDFTGNANNTVVQPVEETIKEQWFQDAIRDEHVDLFIVAGHVPVSDSRESDAVYKAIRNVKWDTPIQFFGGHTHIRDYHRFDKKAYGIESGRYMETIGFMSISGLGTGKEGVTAPLKTPAFERRYIDNNLFSLHHHSGKNSSTFATEHGRNVSVQIADARKSLKLDETYGCAPQDYWLNRAPYPSEDSILTWLEKEVVPDSVSASSSSQTPSVVLSNSGAMRFDIFAGPFTIDTTFLVSPFTSGFRKIPHVPYKAAQQVLSLLNNEGKILTSDLLAMSARHPDLGDFGPRALYRLAPPSPPVNAATKHASATHQLPQTPRGGGSGGGGGGQTPMLAEQTDKRIPGYTTVDDAGADGDDTIHAPITFYDVPNVIASYVHCSPEHNNGTTPQEVELVYNEFIERWILLALRYLGLSFAVGDTRPAMDGKTFTDVISEWVHENWAC